MKREELNFVLENNQYLEGGTKEACVKVRDFLHYATDLQEALHSSQSCVSTDEFVEAVKTLMAFAFREKDAIPEYWECDSDCRRVSYLLCPGECNIRKNVNKRCPFFMDEGFI